MWPEPPRSFPSPLPFHFLFAGFFADHDFYSSHPSRAIILNRASEFPISKMHRVFDGPSSSQNPTAWLKMPFRPENGLPVTNFAVLPFGRIFDSLNPIQRLKDQL
jgi:hypothetical protein